MLVTYTRVPFDPEQRQEMMTLVEELVAYSRSEDGTVRYDAMTDIESPNVVVFFEQYEDAAAAEIHTESDQYRQFMKSLPDLVEGEIETVQFQTEDVSSVEFTAIEAAETVE